MELFGYTIIKTSKLKIFKKQLVSTQEHTKMLNAVIKDYEDVIESLTESSASDKENKLILLKKLLNEEIKKNSQIYIEQVTGIKQSLISRIVNDIHVPKYATMVRYIRLLNEI